MQKLNPKYISDSKLNAIRSARTARITVNIFALILGLIFGFLKLKGISITPFVNNLSADLILKFSLVIYYFSWVAGTISDTNDQEIVYIRGPKKERFPFHVYVVASIIAIAFGLLCWANNFQRFALALSTFWIINLISWRYMISFIVGEIIIDSQKEYQSINSFSLFEKLNVVKNYIDGKWQWNRFIIGLLLLIIINMLAFTPLSTLVSQYLKISLDFINSISILAYIIFVETWIWIKRIQTKVSISTIEIIDKKYQLNLMSD